MPFGRSGLSLLKHLRRPVFSKPGTLSKDCITPDVYVQSCLIIQSSWLLQIGRFHIPKDSVAAEDVIEASLG